MEQKPFDPKKRTVVVLGSGWGAVSFLKSINTDDYNVVCVSWFSREGQTETGRMTFFYATNMTERERERDMVWRDV